MLDAEVVEKMGNRVDVRWDAVFERYGIAATDTWSVEVNYAYAVLLS